jgi:hypothetical protein
MHKYMAHIMIMQDDSVTKGAIHEIPFQTKDYMTCTCLPTVLVSRNNTTMTSRFISAPKIHEAFKTPMLEKLHFSKTLAFNCKKLIPTPDIGNFVSIKTW